MSAGAPAVAGSRAAAGTRRASALGSVLLGSLAAALVAGRFVTALLAIAVAALAAAAAGAAPPPRRFWTALAWGAGAALALNLYLVPGVALALPRVLGRAATGAGLAAGTLLALRLAGAATALHGLHAAWPGERAADEIAGRLRPLERLGLPVREGRAMIALGLRFAPLLAAEWRRIAKLQELRAGAPARRWRERLERRRAVAVPAVVAALETAERVALGLEARHYRLRPVAAPAAGAVSALAGVAVFATALLWRA